MTGEAEGLQRRLLAALADPACYPHPVGRIERVETHISWVLLTGPYAYKLKKALDLGFLDFATLDRRRHFCEEELRLNRRLAPELYLDVVPVAGSPEAPRVGGAGPALEWAVKMRQFDQDGLLDRLLARGALPAERIDELAQIVAGFHARADRAGDDSPYGSPEAVAGPVMQNFGQLGALLADSPGSEALEALRAWTAASHEALVPVMARRKREGFVRECHGDLHPGNIALVDGALRVFDCIEFDPNLRWIDVANEIAFLTMDLAERGHPKLAWRFLDGYLARTGDHGALALLRYYQVYRALVRAKVAGIRGAQGGADREAALADCREHLALARRVAEPGRPALLVMHGLSGAGKTVASGALLEALGAVRLRSDVERKRLAGLAPSAGSGSPVAGGLYARDATQRTYEALRRLARGSLQAGYPTIVDAACLLLDQRRGFRDLAEELRVPFVLLHCEVPPEILRSRIAERMLRGADASEASLAVLEHQLATCEPLEPQERDAAVRIGAQGVDAAGLSRIGAAMRGPA